MSQLAATDINEANQKAVEAILSAQAVLVDLRPAGKAIPGFKPDLITYAGPPISWERMCFVQKRAIINLAIHEGLADTPEKADKLISRGEITIAPNHQYNNVSGMCGATSASLPVLVFEDRLHERVAYTWLQTDLTSFGDKYERGVKEIEFIQEILAPVMQATIREAGGINVKELLARGLQMGDELHGSFDASRGIFLNWIMPYMLRTDFPKDILAQVGDYFLSNQGRWSVGNLMMGGCKVMMDAARDIRLSTVITTMASNGVEFGIRVSGLGDKWFTGPAGAIVGRVFPGYQASDSAPCIGDSPISETRGLGGTVLSASPSHAKFMGVNFSDAVAHTKSMYEVSIAEDPTYRIPYLDFRGTPVGLDLNKIIKTGITPKINAAMAHKEGGHPMIGAGVAAVPFEAFKAALEAFVQEYV